MANYVLVYKGGSGMAQTEAEQAAVMAAWGKWFGELGPGRRRRGQSVRSIGVGWIGRWGQGRRRIRF